MKYLEKYKSFTVDDILGEIGTTKEIEDFFKKHNLNFIDVQLPKKTIRVYYGDFNGEGETIYHIIHGQKEELGVGIKRYKVPKLLKDILNFLNNMSEDDIEIEKAKFTAPKYNI